MAPITSPLIKITQGKELANGVVIAETGLRTEVVAVRKAEVVRITIPTARGVDIVSPFMK